MNISGIIISQSLSYAVIAAVFLHAVRRNRLRTQAHLNSLNESLKAEVAAAKSEAAKAMREIPATLLLSLNLLDESVVPDLPLATQQAQTLVSALSQQERSLGGLGLTLTAAKVEPGALRLTLSPVERLGSAERVKRVAEDVNASSSPLPPGISAAHAAIMAS